MRLYRGAARSVWPRINQATEETPERERPDLQSLALDRPNPRRGLRCDGLVPTRAFIARVALLPPAALSAGPSTATPRDMESCRKKGSHGRATAAAPASISRASMNDQESLPWHRGWEAAGHRRRVHRHPYPRATASATGQTHIHNTKTTPCTSRHLCNNHQTPEAESPSALSRHSVAERVGPMELLVPGLPRALSRVVERGYCHLVGPRPRGRIREDDLVAEWK